MLLRARDRVIRFPRRPLVMGIVNLNDDSFCGDGTLDPTEAMNTARQMAADGADIIDAGAESARTNRGPISIDEEIRRMLPFLEAYGKWAAETSAHPAAQEGQVHPPLLSLNTWRPEVVKALLPHGVHILNDIGGLPDDRNARLCAEHGAALLIMHSQGAPKEKHTHAAYPDIMEELDRFFREKLTLCAEAGLDPERVLLDPGLDFAKQRADNLRICRDLRRLHVFGCPVLLPVSRKTVIGQVLDLPDPLDRDAGTIACIARGITEGAAIFRVHNVPAAAQAVRLLHSLEDLSAAE